MYRGTLRQIFSALTSLEIIWSVLSHLHFRKEERRSDYDDRKESRRDHSSRDDKRDYSSSRRDYDKTDDSRLKLSDIVLLILHITRFHISVMDCHISYDVV